MTNIDKGFAAMVFRHFIAQYHATCRSGIGIACDWTGDYNLALPKRFDHALMDLPEPKWDFQKWIPDLLVICLGLNDYSGLKREDGTVSEKDSQIFRQECRHFLTKIRRVCPGVAILAVAAHVDWIQKNVRQVVSDEKANEYQDIYYVQFDYIQDGYVANGRPNVKTHQKIAEMLIMEIVDLKLFSKQVLTKR